MDNSVGISSYGAYYADVRLGPTGLWVETQGPEGARGNIELRTQWYPEGSVFTMNKPSVRWPGLTKRSAISGADWAYVFYNRNTGQLATD